MVRWVGIAVVFFGFLCHLGMAGVLLVAIFLAEPRILGWLLLLFTPFAFYLVWVWAHMSWKVYRGEDPF